MKSATGQKVKKTFVKTGSPTVTTDYLDGFQYKNTVLEFFGHAEGFVANGSYVYQYKDQLGNVRMSYDKNPVTGLARILDENHYYPYGLKHAGYGTNTSSSNAAHKYRYNSREWQDEEDLNLTAMDFRMYDNAIGRFYGMDALSEKNHYLSPFQFADGNPVYYSDPSGLTALKNEAHYDSDIRTGNEEMTRTALIGNYGLDFGGGGGGAGRYGSGDVVGGTMQDLLNSIYKEMDRLGVNNYSINRNSNGVFWATYAYGHTDYGDNWSGTDIISVKFDSENEDSYSAYGNTFEKHISNINYWKDLGISLMFGGNSNAQSVSMEDNPLSFVGPGSAVKGLKLLTKIRAFWSGAGTEAKALELGFGTLGQTRAGQNLIKLTEGMPYYPAINGQPASQAYQWWARLSTQYAKGASGNVHVFQNAQTGVGVESIWRLYEYPTLLRNPNVTNIIYHY